eukprot:TRINITY_DN25477_c0_g1_i2.p1 TRINITY_DN25477_c0_g1~~TRINITY_DN25477_c0_g1_i2.p1  ORF type:complete len:132 (+),score=15.78 TRINITY_DN25477_c0_g1_i2:383-778(+)
MCSSCSLASGKLLEHQCCRMNMFSVHLFAAECATSIAFFIASRAAGSLSAYSPISSFSILCFSSMVFSSSRATSRSSESSLPFFKLSLSSTSSPKFFLLLARSDSSLECEFLNCRQRQPIANEGLRETDVC